jgi:SAM-dependent methyltransferase
MTTAMSPAMSPAQVASGAAVATVAVACSVCGSRDQVGVPARTTRSTWVICASCGLVFQSPRADARTVESRYATGEYHVARGGVPEHYVAYSLRRSEPALRWALERVAPGRGWNALDIGCGVGGALVGLRASGFETAGVEPDPQLSAIARERFGLEVETGFFDETTFADRAFDLVYSCHVWEHLVDPVATARAAFGRLRINRGYFMVVVPTHERARTASWRYMNADHTHLYTATSLGNVLRAAGFDVVDVAHRTAGDAELWMLARASSSPTSTYGYRVESVADVRRAILAAPLRAPLGVPVRAVHHLETLRSDPRDFAGRARRAITRLTRRP